LPEKCAILQVFSRERMNGHYGVAVFVISNTLSSLPYIFLMALISGSIVYVMVQLHHGIEHYIYFILCLFAELACADSLMMAVATICPTFLVGILVGSCIQVQCRPSSLSHLLVYLILHLQNRSLEFIASEEVEGYEKL
jgi:ABC-type methionine transport system permease subunit